MKKKIQKLRLYVLYIKSRDKNVDILEQQWMMLTGLEYARNSVSEIRLNKEKYNTHR